MTYMERNILDAVRPVAEALESLGIAYYITGSVANSAYGFARTTLDVDLVADLRIEHVNALIENLQDIYYVDAQMVFDAIQHRASFNLVHLPTMIKVDVFIPKNQPFDEIAFQRVQLRTLSKGDEAKDAYPFHIASPEDVILRKLDWYRMGGAVSEHQWKDVVGVLKVQAPTLDYAYLQEWGITLGLKDLLDQAIDDADLQE